MSTIPLKSKLDEYVRLGMVRSQRHPTLPLNIYVYTEFTQFERLWNNVTRACRGLVVDDKGRCVVRCLPKFFNEDEPHAVCDIPKKTVPILFDKLDGSLIQVVNDEEYGLVVTSKGSFNSDQSNWATEIINEQYKPEDFSYGKTYVFELIHPENRIVVDYKGDRNLYLLAVIKTESGNEDNIFRSEYDKFNIVQTVDDRNKHLKSMTVEGLVVKTGDHRYKVKTGEYLRLHRIMTGFTPKRVWESMMEGENLAFHNMPEEFEQWLQDTISEIQGNFDQIKEAALKEYESTKELTAKEVGLSTDLQYKGLVFMLRNDKDVDKSIWKMVKPKKGDDNANSDA